MEYFIDINSDEIHDIKSSQIIPKCINDIFLFYLTSGIQHCNKYNKNNAKRTDYHTAPGKYKIDVVTTADRPSDHAQINEEGN